MTDYITGGSGFLGKRLAQRLPEAVLVPHDEIVNWQFANCSRVFFLSAYGNMSNHTNRWAMIGANVSDLILAMNKVKGGLESFMYVSTSSVTLPVQTPYSRTKRAAEEVLLASGLPACIVRPYSVTGVGEQPQHLIPTLIRSCMEGEAMEFVPNATHDYIDVEDVVDGLIQLADWKRTGVYELASGTSTTNEEVLGLVESACGKKANIVRVNNMRNYDIPDWYCRAPYHRAAKPLKSSIAEMVEAYRAA